MNSQINTWRESYESLTEINKKEVIDKFMAEFRDESKETYMTDNPVSREVNKAVQDGLSMSSTCTNFSIRSEENLL